LNDYKKNLKLARKILSKSNEKSNTKVKTNLSEINYFTPTRKVIKRVESWMKRIK